MAQNDKNIHQPGAAPACSENEEAFEGWIETISSQRVLLFRKAAEAAFQPVKEGIQQKDQSVAELKHQVAQLKSRLRKNTQLIQQINHQVTDAMADVRDLEEQLLIARNLLDLHGISVPSELKQSSGRNRAVVAR